MVKLRMGIEMPRVIEKNQKSTWRESRIPNKWTALVVRLCDDDLVFF